MLRMFLSNVWRKVSMRTVTRCNPKGLADELEKNTYLGDRQKKQTTVSLSCSQLFLLTKEF